MTIGVLFKPAKIGRIHHENAFYIHGTDADGRAGTVVRLKIKILNKAEFEAVNDFDNYQYTIKTGSSYDSYTLNDKIEFDGDYITYYGFHIPGAFNSLKISNSEDTPLEFEVVSCDYSIFGFTSDFSLQSNLSDGVKDARGDYPNLVADTVIANKTEDGYIYEAENVTIGTGFAVRLASDNMSWKGRLSLRLENVRFPENGFYSYEFRIMPHTKNGLSEQNNLNLQEIYSRSSFDDGGNVLPVIEYSENVSLTNNIAAYLFCEDGNDVIHAGKITVKFVPDVVQDSQTITGFLKKVEKTESYISLKKGVIYRFRLVWQEGRKPFTLEDSKYRFVSFFQTDDKRTTHDMYYDKDNYFYIVPKFDIETAPVLYVKLDMNHHHSADVDEKKLEIDFNNDDGSYYNVLSGRDGIPITISSLSNTILNVSEDGGKKELPEKFKQYTIIHNSYKNQMMDDVGSLKLPFSYAFRPTNLTALFNDNSLNIVSRTSYLEEQTTHPSLTDELIGGFKIAKVIVRYSFARAYDEYGTDISDSVNNLDSVRFDFYRDNVPHSDETESNLFQYNSIKFKSDSVSTIELNTKDFSYWFNPGYVLRLKKGNAGRDIHYIDFNTLEVDLYTEKDIEPPKPKPKPIDWDEEYKPRNKGIPVVLDTLWHGISLPFDMEKLLVYTIDGRASTKVRPSILTFRSILEDRMFVYDETQSEQRDFAQDNASLTDYSGFIFRSALEERATIISDDSKAAREDAAENLNISDVSDVNTFILSEDSLVIRESRAERNTRRHLETETLNISDESTDTVRESSFKWQNSEERFTVSDGVQRIAVFRRSALEERMKIRDSAYNGSYEETEDRLIIFDVMDSFFSVNGDSGCTAVIRDDVSSQVVVNFDMEEAMKIISSADGKTSVIQRIEDVAYIDALTDKTSSDFGEIWTANNANWGMSRYELPVMYRICHLGDVLCIESLDGTYLLDGGDETIRARISTGAVDFGRALTHPLAAYLEYDADEDSEADMSVSTTQDGNKTAYVYRLAKENAKNRTNGRFIFGRGLRGRHFGFEMSVSAKYFNVDDLYIDFSKTNRRV